jgi:hypothetical protein
MPQDTVQVVNLILNAGGVVVFLGALLTGFVYTRAAVIAILAEKDARIEDLKDRNLSLNKKISDLTSALQDSVDGNKRLADIWEDRQRMGR